MSSHPLFTRESAVENPESAYCDVPPFVGRGGLPRYFEPSPLPSTAPIAGIPIPLPDQVAWPDMFFIESAYFFENSLFFNFDIPLISMAVITVLTYELQLTLHFAKELPV